MQCGKLRLTAVVCGISLGLTMSLPSSSNPEYAGVEVLCEKKNPDMKIALTFDDGPHPTLTREILGILDEYGIKATFFMIGQNIGYYPETAAEVIAAGHEVGNHTFSHPRLRQFSDDSLVGEILATEGALLELGEYRPHLFRPPEGICGERVATIADRYSYTVVLWNVDTRDWAHTPPSEIARNVTENIRSGGIILCHDYIVKDSPTPEALRMFIPRLLEEGYKFVTVSELLLS